MPWLLIYLGSVVVGGLLTGLLPPRRASVGIMWTLLLGPLGLPLAAWRVHTATRAT